MASVVGIYNIALTHLGEARVSATTSQKAAVVAINEIYDDRRDHLQRSHAWHFARETTIPALIATAPAIEYSYAFRMPAENLRILGVYADATLLNEVVFGLYRGGQIRCDYSVIYARYIHQVTDVNEMPPDFRYALGLDLAAQVCVEITSSRTLAEKLAERASRALISAQSVDSQEQGSEDFPVGGWVTARSS